jgi:type III secretion protein V
MELGAAMAKYSILTVGDGMVAQIPALLGAMSAGLIVTRATDDQTDRHLGDSIQKQLTAIPRVTLVAGGLCLLLALVPGFPSGVFVVLGLLLVGTGALLVPVWRSKIDKVTKPTFEVIRNNKEIQKMLTTWSHLSTMLNRRCLCCSSYRLNWLEQKRVKR